MTTGSCCRIRWGGYRFCDAYQRLFRPRVKPHREARWVVFRGADGHRASLLLEDALVPDVLLADQMNGEALGFEHGAPLRLVAPEHYGYKSVKHLTGIEFWSEFKPGPGLLEHPRAGLLSKSAALDAREATPLPLPTLDRAGHPSLSGARLSHPVASERSTGYAAYRPGFRPDLRAFVTTHGWRTKPCCTAPSH